MARASDIVGVAAPVLLAVIIGVAYQFGYITFLKTPDEMNLSNGLLTVEQRLKELEVDISKLGNKEETQNSIKGLEERLDEVQAILEVVKLDTRADMERLLGNGGATKRELYITDRDKVIFLMLGGLTILQIGLVTSIFFLFRKLKKTNEENDAVNIDEKYVNPDSKDAIENNNKTVDDVKDEGSKVTT